MSGLLCKAIRAVAGALFVLSIVSDLTAEPGAISPTQSVNLLEGEFDHHLDGKESSTGNRNEAWARRPDGSLWVTGRGLGYIRTRREYENYHLVLEYRWGEHTWGKWSERARRGGVLLHVPASAGNLAGVSKPSIEVSLEEGKTGSLVVHQGKAGPARFTANVGRGPNEEHVWSAESPQLLFPALGRGGDRVLRSDFIGGWKDVKGFRAREDLENPVGEWNRLEVGCRGESIRVFLNGKAINEVTEVLPEKGSICLFSSGAEYFVRRFELWPLDTFEETWKPEERSTDTGYSETGDSILPRREPWTPEESKAAWRIDGDYEIQLVAAEPVVCDPVDVVWDENGQMFVAELRDYPFPPDTGPRLSRIRRLVDADGDGRMDEAATWADELPFVQGLLCIDGGLLATSIDGVLFLKDGDGDGKAEIRGRWFSTNKARHSQLQIASPRWRLDNTIHLNNGIDGKEIHPEGNPDQTLAFRGFNLTLDPRTRSLTTESGIGQFGATIDDYGRVFFCSNRNPAMFSVLPKSAAERNPSAGIRTGHADIQPPASKVYPLELSHTTSVAHAGTHTSACGICVYRGERMPGLRGNLFVCDPTSQLVTRNRLVPNGSSMKAERIGDRRDFLASTDEWCRPVNLRNGPDGALYICDMYRRFIDHAIYFPEAFSKSNYMRAGFDHGRIWRLVPKGSSYPYPEVRPIPSETDQLPGELASGNAWRREHAQRLLVASADSKTVPALTELLERSPSPLARLHALWTLQGIHERTGAALPAAAVLRATEDADHGVVENAVALAARRKDVDLESRIGALFKHGDQRVRMLAAALHGSNADTDQLASIVAGGGDDPWLRRAVMSISPETPAAVLARLLENGEFHHRDVFSEFAAAVGARGEPSEIGTVAGFIVAGENRRELALVSGLAEGLKRSKYRSLSHFLEIPPASIAGGLEGVRTVLGSAGDTAADRNLPTSKRIEALALAQGDLFLLVGSLIDPVEPPEIQSAACRTLSALDPNKVADFFFDRWDTLAPIPRREALNLITGNSSTTVRLMKKMKAGTISKTLMPPMSRWVLSRSSNAEIKSLALELFGKADTNRARVVNEYIAKLERGDAHRGETVFRTAGCATCHSIGDATGGAAAGIGLNIRDVRNKPPSALVSDILDPNRVVEERWTAFTVKMRSGEEFAGLVTSDTGSGIELALPGGIRKQIPREDIDSFASTGLSLMPEGLEAAISPREMSDLIAFLKNTQ